MYFFHAGEQITAALTETELSDWARDGAVSDDFEVDEFELPAKKLGAPARRAKIASIGELDELSHHHVCGRQKQTKDAKNKSIAGANFTDLENIEFMDTGTETSSDDGAVDADNGYVRLNDDDDSLSPKVNGIVEATNPNVEAKNKGYCVVDNNFGAECIDLKASDLEKLKQNRANAENEEDSLLILEAGTTTEETTCSDSTVKNITEKVQENNNENKEYKEHCQRLQSKVEFSNARDSIDIRKSRRKSKSESPPKPDLIQEEKESAAHKEITLQLSPVVRAPEQLYKKEEIERERDKNQKLIQEMVMNKMKSQNKTLERKKRNRNIFSPNMSPNRPFELAKSATTDLTSHLSTENTPNLASNAPHPTSDVIHPAPDVILPAAKILSPLQKSSTISSVVDGFSTPTTPETRKTRPLSVFSAYIDRQKQEIATDASSLPDIKKAMTEEFKTPVAPPRTKHEETKRTAEKMKQNARARARLLSNEELGLSPEEKLKLLREKIGKSKENIDVHVQDSIESLVINTERRNSLLYANDTLSKKRNNSFRRSKSGEETVERKLEMLEQKCMRPTRTKSVSELNKRASDAKLQISSDIDLGKVTQFHKSDPNLLSEPKKSKKKGKDSENRKSISKIFSTLFAKKKDGSGTGLTGGSKGFLSRISPKSKDKSKVGCVAGFLCDFN